MKSKLLRKLKREIEMASDITLAQFLIVVLEEINRRGANLMSFVPSLVAKE